MLLSKLNLYWNPEQPPPSTITLKQVFPSVISFKRLTQLSLIIISSSLVLLATLVDKFCNLDSDFAVHGVLR